MSYCPKCGYLLKPDARFCGKCGYKINRTSLTIDLQEKVCKYCKITIEPGVKYCSKCGNPVDVKTQNPTVSIPVPPAIIQKTEGKKPRKASQKLLFAILFLSIIVAGSVLYYYKFYSNVKSISQRPEYMIKKVVHGDTKAEAKRTEVIPGKESIIELGDGSIFKLPAGQNKGSVEFSKFANYLEFSDNSGFQVTGCLRSISFDNTQLFDNNYPTIIIPASQIGRINPVTVRILRIDNIKENDNNLKGDGFFIPVNLNAEGNIEFTDNFLSNSSGSPVSLNVKRKPQINQASLLPLPQPLDVDVPVARERKTGNGAISSKNKVIYAIVTFQSDINWTIDGKLVLMKPDPQIPKFFRKPWDLSLFSKTTHPITNIYILVHGHNEAEKGGFGSTKNPDNSEDYWLVDYKRDLWNPFYKFFLDNLPENANPESDCNLFFEFIYPTYRPIYSTVLPNSNENHQTLGEQFGKEINELFEFTPRLRNLIDEKIPFNLYIISHSMGGLVARAGLRHMDQEIYSHFTKLITWGTPHDGSPLVSMSYVMRSKYNIQVPGIPFSGLVDYAASQKGLQDYLLLDTPGSRDLRADLVKPINFWKYFHTNDNQILTSPATNLKNGTEIYNYNLKVFNASEPSSNQGKFVFFYGLNTNIFVNNPNLSFYENAKEFMKLTEPQKGTYLLNHLLDSSFNNNDGAVPVYSAQGIGLSVQPKVVGFSNCDHEQFFDSKIGEAIAKASIMEIYDSTKCNCPEITEINSSGDTITGIFEWGIYSEPGKSIKDIKTTLKGKNKFSWKPDGSFIGEVDASQYSESHQDSVYITLVDGSKIGTNIGFFISLEGEWEGEMIYPDGLRTPYHSFFKKIKNINKNLVILYGYYWAKSANKDVKDEWGFVYPFEISPDGTILTYSENWLKPEIATYSAKGNNLKITFSALPIKPVYDVNNVELDIQGQKIIRTVNAKRIKRPADYFPSKEYDTWAKLVKANEAKIPVQLENYNNYKDKYQKSILLFK